MLLVSDSRTEASSRRVEEELALLDYSVDHDRDAGAALERLRARDVDAVIVLSEDGRGQFYVLRSGSTLVETRLEDAEHTETFPVKMAEGVRTALRAEQERSAARRTAPSFELSLGPVLDASSYANPRLGFEAIGLWRLSERLFLGPRAKANLPADYGETKSELGASNVVLALTGCTPFPIARAVTLGLCASLGTRAIVLRGISGPQKGESAGAIWGPLVGGSLSANFDLAQHFALKSAFSVDAGFGGYSGPDSLPKRSTDLLAEQSSSSYFGIDVGLGFYAVYLVR